MNWEIDLESLIVSSSIVSKNNYVYFITNTVFCLKTENGKIKWKYDIDDLGYSSTITPTLFDSELFVANSGFIYCFVEGGIFKQIYYYLYANIFEIFLLMAIFFVLLILIKINNRISKKRTKKSDD